MSLRFEMFLFNALCSGQLTVDPNLQVVLKYVNMGQSVVLVRLFSHGEKLLNFMKSGDVECSVWGRTTFQH